MLLVAPLVHAQEDEEEEIFELSPFEVTAEEGGGYRAVSTLAGNRLNTELRDVGSAISVVTEQFLEDTGATDNTTLLQYTVGTEVGSIEGNYAGAGDSALLDESSKFINPNANTRVRGLTNADNSRDYFISDIPWDGYNVDRVELQRGPNSILFGLGSPAGLINVGLKNASWENEGEVELRFDEHGSLRTVFDFNKVILEDELAIRITALRDDEKFKQDPAYNLDERLFAALRYDPSFLNGENMTTNFKAKFETGEVESNNPRSLPPVDLISPWFYSGTYQNGDGTRTFNHINRATYNPFQVQDDNTGRPNHGQQRPTINGGPNAGQPNPAYNPYVGNFADSFGGPLGYFTGDPENPTYWLQEWRQRRGINEEGVVTPNQGIVSFHRPVGIATQSAWAFNSGQPYADLGVYKNNQITDPTAFDFYNNLLDGPNKNEFQNFDMFQASLAQTYLNNKVGWELSHHTQSYDNGQYSLLSGSKQAIYIDMMAVHADGTPEGLNGEPFQDGTPNPNVGRAFISDRGQFGNNTFLSDRSATRMTAFATYDFQENDSDSFLNKLLGKHTFTGLLGRDERDTDQRNFLRYAIVDEAYREFIAPQPSEADFDSNLFAVNTVIYMGPNLSNRSSLSGANLPATKTRYRPNSGTIMAFDSTWAHPLDPNAAGYVDPAAEWINNYHVGPDHPLFQEGDPDDPDDRGPYYSTQSRNPANYVGWRPVPFNVTHAEDSQANRDLLTTSAELKRSKVETKALVWQGHLFGGALVGTYGRREDTAEGWEHSQNTDSAARYLLQYKHLNLDPSVYNLQAPDASYSVVEETSTSWSAVAHLNEFLNDSLPIDISLSYSHSTNFQPEALRTDVYGEGIPLPQGETEDIGLILATKDGRYSLRVNKYETEATNANSGGLDGAWFIGNSQVWSGNWVNRFEYDWTGDTIDNAVEDPDPGNSMYNYGVDVGEELEDAQAREAAAIAAWRQWQGEVDPRFYAAWGIDLEAPLRGETMSASAPNGFALTEDSTSEGYEFELLANPTENWSIAFNAAKTEASRKNIGGANLAEFMNAYSETLNTTAAGDLRIWWGGAGNETALFQWNGNVGSEWTQRALQEGTNVPELRKWRANAITNYNFTDGAFKGLSVGGGLRWQDEIVIGYPPFYQDDGSAGFEIDNPYTGPSETNVDLWVGYEKALTDRLDWRIQLNVRNAFSDEGLIPITVQPDGTPAGYRIAPARTWSVRNTFSF
ncbi:TonB-dependent receptor plug domain-containing protein [Pelagicoccus sp. SDUM812003]|nr:TonB-dependent receptor plug domain-containing protein [Pelagicoccus sp. SDUM812003]